MNAAGFFERFYASAWQHPGLLWIAALLAAIYCIRRRDLAPSLRSYCAALCLLSLADAWLSANQIFGIGRLPEGAATAASLFFVLAGDFRFLLLAVAGRADGSLSPRAADGARAAGLTLVVPLATQIVLTLLPARLDVPRVMFLVYELCFFLWTLLLLRRLANLREQPWLRRVANFVLLYYGLWAGADALLLATGSDLGFLLRVVPNLLYYGGLIVWIAYCAPLSVDQRPRSSSV